MEEDKTVHAACAPAVRLALRVSYLGGGFLGSQIQATARTVEGEFVAACRRLNLFADRKQAGFLSSGRTDRGVHARGLVMAFSTGVPDRAIQALNMQLPPDCWCCGYAKVPEAFHPRYDAKTRTYRYYFSPDGVDCETMKQAAGLFIGRHNFTNLARAGNKNPMRTILDAQVCDDDGYAYLEVKAESFLWHQVRYMVAALMLAGKNKADGDFLRSVLEGRAARTFQPAPPEGLILWETDCGIAWVPMPGCERAIAHTVGAQGYHSLMATMCRVIQKTET